MTGPPFVPPAALAALVAAEIASADRRARIVVNLHRGRAWNRGIKTGTPEWCRARRRARRAS